MKIKTVGRLLLIWAFALPSWMAAQTASEPDASPVPKDAAPPASSAERPVSWKQLIPNLASDQKQIWRFPIRAHRDKHWVPAAAVLAVTAGLIAADPHEGAYFRRASAFDGFNHVFSGNATGYGMIAAPVSLYAAGLIGKDSKMRGTALLAGEAVVDSEILTTILKDSLRRLRPVAIPPRGTSPTPGSKAQDRCCEAMAACPRATPSRRSPLPLYSPGDMEITAGCPLWPMALRE